MNFLLMTKFENVKEYKKFLSKSFLLLVTFILCSYIVFGTNELEAEYLWTNHHNTESLTGDYGQSGGVWANISTINRVTASYGSAFSPLTIQNQLYNITEMVVMSGNTLKIFYYETGNSLLTVRHELDLGNAQSQNGAIIRSPDGYRIIIPVADSIIKNVLYNSSGLYLKNSFNISSINSTMSKIQSAPVCSGFNMVNETCYFGIGTSGTGNVYNIVKYVPQTNKTSKFHVAGSAAPISVAYLLDDVFPVYDWDLDTKLEIGMISAITAYCSELVVYDTDTGVRETYATVGTCSGSTYANTVGQLLFYNGDGYGYADLFINDGWTSSSAHAGISISRLAKDGTLTQTNIKYIGGGPYLGTPKYMVAGFFKQTSSVSAERMVCSGYTTSWNPSTGLGCVNTNTMVKTFEGNTSKEFYSSSNILVGADYTGDGIKDIISSTQIYDVANKNSINLTGSLGGTVILGDFNYNGYGDIFAESAGLIQLFLNDAQATTPGATDGYLGMNIIRNLHADWSNPICKGTTQTWKAYDCSNYSVDICNYNNFYGYRTEYLYMICNGVSKLGVPDKEVQEISCQYNTTGFYAVKICITDTVEGISPSTDECWDYTLQVINGTSGNSCNTNSAFGSEIIKTATPTSTEQDVSSLFDTLTFGNSWIKTIIAIASILGVIIFLATKGVNNPMVHALVVICVLVLEASVGLVSWAVILLIGLLISLIGAIAWFTGGNNG